MRTIGTFTEIDGDGEAEVRVAGTRVIVIYSDGTTETAMYATPAEAATAASEIVGR